MQPPVAKKIPTRAVYHGDRVLTDDYAWMKQENWKEMFADTSLLDPDIKAYLDAENAYTKEKLIDPQQTLIDTLIAEMKARTEIYYDSAPIQDGPFAYFTRLSDADYPVFLRRDASGIETVMLDVTAELATDGKKVFLGDLAHSPDHHYLAIAVDYSGSEDHEIIVKDLVTGQFLIDRLLHADNIVWHPTAHKFYYTRMSDTPGEFRRDRVFCHILGHAQADDTLIFTSDDPAYFLDTDRTDDKRFLTIGLKNSTASEIHVLDLHDPDAIPVCLASRSENILYDVCHAHDLFYIHTNASGAVEFKIMTAPTATPQIQHWRELIPTKPGRLIAGIRASANHLVRMEYENCLPRLIVGDLTQKATHEVSFDDPAYYATAGNARGFDSDWMRIVYSSPRMPTQHFDYNMVTQERILVRQEKIAGHDPDNYIVQRVFIPSHDRAQVPLTIVRRKDTPIDGTAPLLLYGYGSYGAILHSHFSHYNPSRYTLLDRGFIVVDAHIRGGADMGHQWYLDGKLMQKKNTFFDFIAAAEWLVENNYTAKGKIAAEGGSAGGMLVGAAANMAEPGLFGAIVAIVPFVDVMNTILDEKLPLTPPEWKEWGNPVTDPAAFDYMRSYSPYDNVMAKAYPALFIGGGLTDPRVTYWEPAKWAAKLRASHTGDSEIFLRIAMDSGHGGDPGRFSHLPEQAQELAFILSAVGN